MLAEAVEERRTELREAEGAEKFLLDQLRESEDFDDPEDEHMGGERAQLEVAANEMRATLEGEPD
eukprot:8661404-Alexandrium_andersonii.AAC.1